jgi:four helix bundle protein
MGTTSHRDLRVWQIAMDIATMSYGLAKRLPREEYFGLTSQIRRAAASVPANIAEGYGRYSKNETIRYLNIANGSLVELDTHFELAVRAGYFSEGDLSSFRERARALGAMIFAFKGALRRSPPRAPLAPGPWPVPTSAVSAP